MPRTRRVSRRARNSYPIDSDHVYWVGRTALRCRSYASHSVNVATPIGGIADQQRTLAWADRIPERTATINDNARSAAPYSKCRVQSG